MPSERVQRQIDRLLDEAEAAVAANDWARVRELAQDVLSADPTNSDALGFASMAARRLENAPGDARAGTSSDVIPPASQPVPLPPSFASGRYTVQSFLGEGAKKRVYLAHDTKLARDVAFALIKTERTGHVS